MPQLPGRATAKLTIIPFLDPDFKTPTGDKFIALYNPSTFTLSRTTELAAKPTTNGRAGDLNFLYENNRSLTVDLIIDGTGASPPLGIPIGKAFGAVGNLIPGASGAAANAQAIAQAALSAAAVTKYINFFFSLTGNVTSTPSPDPADSSKSINVDTHTTNSLKVIWGKGLRFKCRLQDATVKYTLFNQLGQPLRATITATFLEAGKNKLNPFQSPDLTKLYKVVAGDTIYNLAKKEYGDESFYLQIAQANDLKNYRRLIPGQALILPPIAKVEE
jgi:nucleoid-associated protein YgaU